MTTSFLGLDGNDTAIAVGDARGRFGKQPFLNLRQSFVVHQPIEVFLGVEHQLGRIAPGALADMILVDGDPLDDVEDSLNIVAVIRNGRFFSLSRLLENAGQIQNVGYFDKSQSDADQ